MLAKIKPYKHYIVVLLFAIIGHGLGFAREIAIAIEFGASSYADGLLVGLAPITFYLSIWGSAYVNAALTRIKTIDNTALIAATSRPLLYFGLFSLLFFLLFAQAMVEIISPGLKDEGKAMAIAIIEVSSLGAILVSLSAWAKGLLHLQKRFARASTADIMPNVGTIIGVILLFPLYGATGVALGCLLGFGLQFVIAVEFKAAYFKLTDQSPELKGQLRVIFHNMALATLSYSVVYIDAFVDRYFASMLEQGSIAIMNFGHKLMSFPLYTLIFAMTTVLFPNLIALSKEPQAFKAKVKQVYRVILWLSFLVMSVSIVLDEWLVDLLFNYGAFNAGDVVKTADVFTIYMLGFAAHAYVVFGSKVRYALEDFRTPIIAGITAAAINVILDIVLVDSMGREGLALATTLSAYANAAILVFYRRKAK